jgi:hypothetical protein
MKGGKRQGAGRRPRFGQYRETTTMRVPIQLKQDVIDFIESMCRDRDQSRNNFVTESNHIINQEPIDSVTLSKEQISQAINILELSLELKANAGGAIKKEIRKALNILLF